MVSEHTLIVSKGERGHRVLHTTGEYSAGRQSVQVTDGCRREGYHPTHLVSGMLYRTAYACFARRNPTDVTPEDRQSNGLSDQSTDGMNSAMVG
jgi:hypothetical protein